VAAGGYHHHLGFNVWRVEGCGPAPARTVGLRHWTIELDTPAQVAAVRARFEASGVPVEADAEGFLVRDPWDIALRVST
jgi:catechol 2,3-dioxygenase